LIFIYFISLHVSVLKGAKSALPCFILSSNNGNKYTIHQVKLI